MRQCIWMQMIAFVLFIGTFFVLRLIDTPWTWASIMGIVLPCCLALILGDMMAASYEARVSFLIGIFTAFAPFSAIPLFFMPGVTENLWFLGGMSICYGAMLVLLISWISNVAGAEMQYPVAILAVATETVVVVSLLVRDARGEPLGSTAFAALGGIIAFLLLLRLTPRPVVVASA